MTRVWFSLKVKPSYRNSSVNNPHLLSILASVQRSIPETWRAPQALRTHLKTKKERNLTGTIKCAQKNEAMGCYNS